jgi:aldose 1-epimerase
MEAEARAKLFTLTNRAGLSVEISNYGGIVTALRVPDRDGRIDDIVLGFDRLDEYLGPHPYFGGIIGRYANRIAFGRFELEGREHVLARNDGPNHLHGGARGFDRMWWRVMPRSLFGGSSLVLSRTSEDGEEGYPGTLACEVTYTLTEANEFRIDYAVTTDRPTVVNLTHHSYFNLAGPERGDVLDHRLFIDADAFLPVDETLIPTGETRPVIRTPFDFREPRPVGQRLDAVDPQIERGKGYDHNFCLNRPRSDPSAARLAARVTEPRTGRVMEILTTEPGLQVYAGGALDGSIVGKGGRAYGRHAGLCLETQRFPDSPNRSAFPSTQLDPEEVYRSTTIHRFSTTP